MWNERYNTEHYIYGTEPNGFLAEHYRSIPKGDVLCLAEGEGRNAVFLASQGYRVTAVDLSAVGLEKAQRLAESRGVEVNWVHADLAEFDLGESRWDGIIAIFAHLPPAVRQRVHQGVVAALKPGGVFLLQAYRPEQLKFGTGGPSDESMLITSQILGEELGALRFSMLKEAERDIIEGSHHTGRAAVVEAIAHKPHGQFQISSNRGQAIHKVRYVESGGGESDENCRLCSSTIKPRE